MQTTFHTHLVAFRPCCGVPILVSTTRQCDANFLLTLAECVANGWRIETMDAARYATVIPDFLKSCECPKSEGRDILALFADALEQHTGSPGFDRECELYFVVEQLRDIAAPAAAQKDIRDESGSD